LRRRPVIMSFGEYKGRTLDEVPTGRSEYYLTFRDLWPRFRQEVDDELRRRREEDGDEQHHHGQLRLPAPDVAVVQEIDRFVRRRLGLMCHPDLHGGDGLKPKLISSTLDQILEWAGPLHDRRQ
jgi:hypothetical protein